MKKLTKDQLSAIQDLTDSPLIEQASIDRHSNTLMRVTVISSLDADWNGVDALLNEIFPEMEYRGKAGVEVKDGIMSEYYSIDVDNETLINLCMKKTLVGARVEKETTQKQFIRNDEVLEPVGPCSIEQIIKQEG